MPPIKRSASSVANSKSGTRFGGTSVRNADPAGFKDPGDRASHGVGGGVVSKRPGRFDAFVSRLVAEGRTKPKANK